jgi:quinol monooxygenase YgiN
MKNNNQHQEIYTLGIWTIKPEYINEFIGEWTLFAKWTSEHISGSGNPYLLQDQINPLRFISFGPWDNESTINIWRSSKEFTNFITTIKVFCEDFQPNTLKVVSTLA